MDKEFLKRRHYLGRNGKRKGSHSVKLFAVAIRAPFCQDCSKAGAAEVDVTQCMLTESIYLNLMQVRSVVRRKQKQELLKIPTTPLVRWPQPCVIHTHTHTSKSLGRFGKFKTNKRLAISVSVAVFIWGQSPQSTLSTESRCSMRLQST